MFEIKQRAMQLKGMCK